MKNKISLVLSIVALFLAAIALAVSLTGNQRENEALDSGSASSQTNKDGTVLPVFTFTSAPEYTEVPKVADADSLFEDVERGETGYWGINQGIIEDASGNKYRSTYALADGHFQGGLLGWDKAPSATYILRGKYQYMTGRVVAHPNMNTDPNHTATLAITAKFGEPEAEDLIYGPIQITKFSEPLDLALSLPRNCQSIRFSVTNAGGNEMDLVFLNFVMYPIV